MVTKPFKLYLPIIKYLRNFNLIIWLKKSILPWFYWNFMLKGKEWLTKTTLWMCSIALELIWASKYFDSGSTKVCHGSGGIVWKAVWAVIIASAILFGLGQLPAMNLLVEPTPLVIVRAIILNGICSVAFYLLLWRRALMTARLAYFFADIMLNADLSVFRGLL